jgi:hypothetical protein
MSAKADSDKCPTCGQSLPDAMTHDPRGAAVQCKFCDKQAHFIIRKTAVCFEHRAKVAA